MPDTLQKLDYLTMHLRGFDRRGAAAALHSASATGFTLSGVWKDSADFAVLVLYDADDHFGHPRCSVLNNISGCAIPVQDKSSRGI